MIQGVRHEMSKRHEHRKRAEQATRIKAHELPRRDRIAHGCPGRLDAHIQGITVGMESTVPRIVLDQERHPSAHDNGNGTEREISFAPSDRADEDRSERRQNERADADPADCEA